MNSNLSLDPSKLALSKAILELRSNSKTDKISISDVAKKAGLSRNAIYKTHQEFLPIIKCKKNIPAEYLEALKNETIDFHDALDYKSEAVMLEQQLIKFKKNLDNEREDFRKKTLSALMQNDLLLHDSQIIKNEQVNVNQQLNDRISDIKRLELKNCQLESQKTKLEKMVNELQSSAGGVVVKKIIEPDLSIAIDDYQKSKDFKDWKLAESFAIKQAVNNTISLANEINAKAIFVFVNSHNASIEAFSKNHVLAEGSYVYVSIPLALRSSRKMVINTLKTCEIPLHAIVPFTTPSQTKWFRTRVAKINLPNVLEKQFDEKWQDVLITEGFKTVEIYSIDTY